MKTDILNNITTLPSARPDRWFVIDEQETSGACLNHLVEKILYPEDELESGHPPPDVFARLDSMASRIAPGCEGLYFTPWLYGERTPVDNRNIRGGFYNMSLSTTRSHLVRSILEGVAFNTRWLLGYVERFIGQEFPAINIIGGGATSTIWCQIFADILERPIRQVRDPLAANARGAAFLTLVALGEMSFSEIEGLVEIERTYMPDASNRSIYRPMFGCYLETYERIRRIHARLNAAG